MKQHLLRHHKKEYIIDQVTGTKVITQFAVCLICDHNCFLMRYNYYSNHQVSTTDTEASIPGQQIVIPMSDKLKSEWDKECVRCGTGYNLLLDSFHIVPCQLLYLMDNYFETLKNINKSDEHPTLTRRYYSQVVCQV